MLLKIYKTESETSEPVAKLSEGEHAIGRGELLNCNDKRISREHALIVVTSDQVTIKSTHDNPCFYKSENENLAILTKNIGTVLKSGDRFALLPDKFWFRVEISDATVDQNNTITVKSEDVQSSRELPTNACNVNGKRKCEDEVDDEQQLKQPKIETTNDVNPDTTTVKKEEVSEEEEEQDVDIGNISTQPISSSGIGSSVATGQFVDGAQSTSGTNKSFRDRCWYGRNCFRKNPSHRQALSHPGDADYETDPEDDRPVCQYGGDCYRRNPRHRAEYRHPRTDGTGRRPKKQRRRKKDGKDGGNGGAKKVDYGDESDLDDYDLEDPFINDGTEDEYEPTSDESESDSEDDEEEEDTRRMLREAKKFTKK